LRFGRHRAAIARTDAGCGAVAPLTLRLHEAAVEKRCDIRRADWAAKAGGGWVSFASMT